MILFKHRPRKREAEKLQTSAPHLSAHPPQQQAPPQLQQFQTAQDPLSDAKVCARSCSNTKRWSFLQSNYLLIITSNLEFLSGFRSGVLF